MLLVLPKFSIVVTVKDEEENIKNLLDSLNKLDYAGERETIIVDGGSTDNTINIISKYSDVKLICCECNISKGRNIGLKNSNGDIVAFTDGDCIVDKDWIKNIANYFSQDLEIGVVGGPYIPRDQQKLVAKYIALYVGTFFPQRTGLTTYTRIGTGNAAYRKELIEKLGGFNEQLRIGEDIDLNLRISQAGFKLFFADDVRVYHKYRTNLGEASRWAFINGKAASSLKKTRDRYFSLFFSYTRAFLLLFIALLLSYAFTSNMIFAYMELCIFALYYLNKLISLKKIAYRPKTRLRDKLSLPILDLYIRSLEFVGYISGLL
jgi:cellulose synthase/poly-beta-1,6-N-acetylglucosamine synthase-like glycosyltransferase